MTVVRDHEQRWIWLDQLMRSTSLASAKIVGACLVGRLNVKTGQLNPSIPTIARDTAQSVRTVARGLRELRRAGFIRWNSDDRARNNFVLVLNGGATGSAIGGTPTSATGDAGSAIGGATVCQPWQTNPENPERTLSKLRTKIGEQNFDRYFRMARSDQPGEIIFESAFQADRALGKFGLLLFENGLEVKIEGDHAP